MSRYIQQGWWFDGNGKVVKSGTVTVYLAGTSTAASIYTASSGGTAVNSVTASSTDGSWSFYVDTDDYTRTQKFKIVFSKSGFTSKTIDDVVIFPEPGLLSWVNVKDHGATGDGVTDDTAAIQEAIDSLAGAAGTIYFPSGVYLTTSGITVSGHRQVLVGDGKNTSKINFYPTVAGTAMTFQYSAASSLVQCGIKDMGFMGSGDEVKTAIKLVDVDIFDLENIAIGGGNTWTDSTYSCVGIQIKGLDFINISKVDVYADTPIQISENPNSEYDIDHTTFKNTYLIASSTNACVLVDSDVNLTNVSFEGYNGWALGGYGFKWVDTETSSQSYNLSLKNIRWERSTNATGWIIDIEHNFVLYNLLVENVYGGGTGENGIKLSKVVHATLRNHTYNGALSALTVDAYTRPVIMENCYYIAGSSITMTGLTKIFDSGLSDALSIVSALTIYDVPSTSMSINSNLYPGTDDTYYLGKNDDDTPYAWKGVVLKDTTNGKYYRLEIVSGSVTATDLTD